MVTRKSVEEQEEAVGVDSPLYVSRVFGEFPKDAGDWLIPHRLGLDHAKNERVGRNRRAPGRSGPGHRRRRGRCGNEFTAKRGKDFDASVLVEPGHHGDVREGRPALPSWGVAT